MNRLIVTVIHDLPETHRARILEAAGSHGFECRFFSEPSEAMPFLEGAEIILGSDPVLSRNAPNLRWMCSHFAGNDPFLAPDAFANPEAMLSNSSGAYGVTISEHVVMMLLEILRRRDEYRAAVGRHEWLRRLPVRSIFGSRITLLGTGDIGRETLQRLRSFEPAFVAGVNRSGRDPGNLFDRILPGGRINEILPETDILVASLPATPETFHLVAEEQLKCLPDDAVVINVGRGSVIDQAALEKELRSGRLYAGLDVFETEPVPPGSTLWTCPHLLITPHVAGDTTLPHTLDRIVDLFIADLERYCAGRPLAGLVDRRIGY